MVDKILVDTGADLNNGWGLGGTQSGSGRRGYEGWWASQLVWQSSGKILTPPGIKT
jgi:hypothetical protein